MAHPFHKRLLKEYRELAHSPPPGIELVDHDDDLQRFVLAISVPDNPLYPASDVYHLLVIVTTNYPVDLPQVTFIRQESKPTDGGDAGARDQRRATIPCHPHVYSNGHICLNLLGDDWTPACLIVLTAVLIQLMLALNSVASPPADDANYCRHAPRNPKQTLWAYHDDTV